MGYYFHKVRLLRQTFGKDASEETLVNDIKDGLPENMVALLRLPRKGATLTELVSELGDWEPNWRKQHKVPLLTATTTTSSTAHSPAYSTTTPAATSAVTRVLQTTMGRSASAPTTPAATASSRAAPSGLTGPKPMSKFAASYDPTRVIPAQNGQPRKYRPPGKDTVMDLRSPCSYCGGDHFNFEHDHIVPQVRTIAVEDDDYEEYLWDGQTEEDGEGGSNHDPSLSLEPGPAPSMFHAEASAEMKPTQESIDDTTAEPTSPGLFFADKTIFSIARTLRPNEAAPPLTQEKRAFGKVIPLTRHSATGTGLGYRNHVPLTTHVRVNDTDGRAMSSLLDTGASLSCIDAALLRKMGGTPHPHGKHVHLEVEQDFHVLPFFAPGMCLGLDFIDAHEITISPIRGRARIGRYTFQVHERLEKPFSAEAELRTTAPVTIAPNTQVWIQINAAALAPGVDYIVIPRLSITPDQSICLAGPNGLITHRPVRQILIGNYGTESFQLEQDTVIADAAAARVGDAASTSAETFTLGSQIPATDVPQPPTRAPDEAAMPFDPFEDIEPTGSSLAHDAATTLVDDAFKVGLDEHGQPHPDVVRLLRGHQDAFALDGRPGKVDGFDMPINLKPDAAMRSEAPRRAGPEKRAAMDSV
ncbi:hypothetical protein CF326_g5318 [Tilletia indica]|nr:hypothetical protein CF326_g5318 [Tilletia indica]